MLYYFWIFVMSVAPIVLGALAGFACVSIPCAFLRLKSTKYSPFYLVAFTMPICMFISIIFEMLTYLNGMEQEKRFQLSFKVNGVLFTILSFIFVIRMKE